MNVQDKLFDFLRKEKYDICNTALDEWLVNKTDEEGIDWHIIIERH